jgi:hypothetical protein
LSLFQYRLRKSDENISSDKSEMDKLAQICYTALRAKEPFGEQIVRLSKKINTHHALLSS